MSIANGVITMEVKDASRVLNIVKHPTVKKRRIKVPTDKIREKKILDTKVWDREKTKSIMEGMQSGKPVTSGVNVFWPNFARWSSISWDPKRLLDGL